MKLFIATLLAGVTANAATDTYKCTTDTAVKVELQVKKTTVVSLKVDGVDLTAVAKASISRVHGGLQVMVLNYKGQPLNLSVNKYEYTIGASETLPMNCNMAIGTADL